MIKISACTIARDEEKNILRWIENVRSFADEIIVVDTGSKDNTRQIAAAQGIKLYDFVWCNDFSAAKNFAIEKAAGNWIVLLDADEFFDEASQRKIRGVVTKLDKDRKVAGIITPFLNIDEDNNNEVISKAWQIRIFRREKELRFAGKIHEALQNLAPAGRDRDYVVVEDLQFIHTGYSRAIIERKLRRNLNLMLEEIEAQGGEHPRQYGYLLDCYAGLHEFDKAIHYGRLALKYRHDTGLQGQENALACKILNAMRVSGIGDYGRALQKYVQEFPKFPEIWFMYGQHLLGMMEGMEAEKALRKALRLYDKPLQDASDVYNLTISDLVPQAKASLAKIEAYRDYYTAMHNADYGKAATQAAAYLQDAYRRYPQEVQRE